MNVWKRSCADGARPPYRARAGRGDGELVADEERQALHHDLLVALDAAQLRD